MDTCLNKWSFRPTRRMGCCFRSFGNALIFRIRKTWLQEKTMILQAFMIASWFGTLLSVVGLIISIKVQAKQQKVVEDAGVLLQADPVGGTLRVNRRCACVRAVG